jgi:hypothetical protein
MSKDFQFLIDRLLSRGLDARYYQMGLDGEIMVVELERETSSGILTGARVLWISRLLNGTWRTRDVAGDLDEGFDETEIVDYAVRRIKASQAEYDAESTRRTQVLRAQTAPELNLPDPVFRVGEAS